jgi:hypothetical protein
VVLEKITETAKQIKGFAALPVTAQVSILYAEIEHARSLSIPLSSICEAMNAADSTVSLRYFREALSVVRRRMKKHSRALGSGQPAGVQANTIPPKKDIRHAKNQSKPVQSAEPVNQHRTPKEARDDKAESYTSSASNNLLLRQLHKQKD